MDKGLTIDGNTIMWWLQQTPDAKKDLKGLYPLDLYSALKQFSKFCNDRYQIWGNSARFDLGILENAYQTVGLPIPWDFRKERCLRTLVSFNPQIKKETIFEGTPHVAIDDCYHQISYCVKIWKSLKSI